MNEVIDRPQDTAEELLIKAVAANQNGEYLAAYDVASSGLALYPDNRWLQFQAVLALTRSGATARAKRLYASFDLAKYDDEDIAALEARIAKDEFLTAGLNAVEPGRRAAALYEAVYEKTNGTFPAINAATLWMLVGDTEKSTSLAKATMSLCDLESEADSLLNYWHFATKAEAALLLGKPEDAKAHLANAGKLAGADFSGVAATRAQLELICAAKGISADLLNVLPIPGVVYYSGHLIAAPGTAGRFAADKEADVASGIAAAIAARQAKFGYGSLASGSDILFAEAFIRNKAELHLVIPFEIEEFIEISVAPAGADWVRRFRECLDKATTVVLSTTGPYMGDDSLFAYTSRIAMGLARTRAMNMGADLTMLAVWDGLPATGVAGTAADLTYWRSNGLKAEVIPCKEAGPKLASSPLAPVPAQDNQSVTRNIYPVMFADLEGFSKLGDAEIVVFFEKVMRRLGMTMDAYGDRVLFRNTWGDALHAVFADVETAAKCALDLQTAIVALNEEGIDMPVDIGMRIGLHVGPVFEGYDHITKEPTYFGSTLTRAARLEPVTPAGEVYVTEALAAICSFECADLLRCEYVGRMPMGKSYGKFPMFHLTLAAKA